jgi:sugar lactone lactonase YvrE
MDEARASSEGATLGTRAARVFFDGMLTEPQLDHPEGLAVHRDGSVWCGGERGQIYRIEPDGSSIEQVASTGGFCLGMAFDADDDLYVCDLKHAAVMKLDIRSGKVERFADGADRRTMCIPNYPAFDTEGRLYVSDSHAFKDPGPGIFRFDLDGSGELWYEEPINFANGLAFSQDRRHLYVAETFGNTVFRVPIEEGGSAGAREEIAFLPGVLPDGLAFDTSGNLYVGCYQPSQVLLISPDGKAECLIADGEAHLLCHPTNLAFRERSLLTSNLGRWHITEISTLAEGLPLLA